jgi:hypothetical protein
MVGLDEIMVEKSDFEIDEPLKNKTGIDKVIGFIKHPIDSISSQMRVVDDDQRDEFLENIQQMSEYPRSSLKAEEVEDDFRRPLSIYDDYNNVKQEDEDENEK